VGGNLGDSPLDKKREKTTNDVSWYRGGGGLVGCQGVTWVLLTALVTAGTGLSQRETGGKRVALGEEVIKGGGV